MNTLKAASAFLLMMQCLPQQALPFGVVSQASENEKKENSGSTFTTLSFHKSKLGSSGSSTGSQSDVSAAVSSDKGDEGKTGFYQHKLGSMSGTYSSSSTASSEGTEISESVSEQAAGSADELEDLGDTSAFGNLSNYSSHVASEEEGFRFGKVKVIE